MKYRRLFILASIGLLPVLWMSCENKKQDAKVQLQTTDGFGRTVHIPINPKRVISLCPSQTECLLKVMDTAHLIAVTTVCTYPENLIKDKIRINSYPPDYEKIVALQPDLVVSLKGMIKPEEVRKLEELGIPVLVQKADSLKHLAHNFRLLGKIFRKAKTGDSLAEVVESVLMRKTQAQQYPRTYLFLFSHQPLYAFGEGNFLNEIFENNGFKNIASLSKFKVPYPILSREYISKNPPDYLFVSSSNIVEGLKEKYPEMATLNIFKSNHIQVINADVCSRPTMRLLQIDSLLKKQ